MVGSRTGAPADDERAGLSRRRFLTGATTLSAAVGLGATTGCSSGSGSGSGTGKGEVVVITWGDPQKAKRLGDAFKEETGITMRLVPGSGDSDFFNKIKAGGGAQYDVVISNVGFASLYEQAGLIETLDLTQFPAADELYPEFRNDSRFSYLKGPDKSLVFPNQWGVYSMTYSTVSSFQPAKPISWEALWQAPKGKVVLDGFYLTNLALAGRMSGLSWDEVFAMDGAPLDRAADRLIQLKPFQSYDSDDLMIDAFRTEKTYIGMVFSLGFAHTLNKKLGKELAASVMPSEGAVGALDGQMLIKGARNRANALKLINFIGGQRAQTIFWDLYHGPTANKAATEAIIARGGDEAALLQAQHGNDPSIAAGLHQLRQPDHPEAWNKVWDRILAA
jgi:spermidine/putrescine transport system substrate-binding protein